MLQSHFSHTGSENLTRARRYRLPTSTLRAFRWLSYSLERTTGEDTFPTRHILCLSPSEFVGGLFRTGVLIECPDDQRTMSSGTRFFHHPR
jgi:hypothetical protein